MNTPHVLSEEDIKLRHITPAITSKGWQEDSIFMERRVKFTDGKINLKGNLEYREKPKYADYVLYANKATPIAIIEAKKSSHDVLYGLQQAMEYAVRLDVKFAYSSNGKGFAEHDFLTGKERTFGMDCFPSCMAKTIVFCADEKHAERMRMALTNANADMCKKNPDYVVRITGSDEYGKGKLDYFTSVSSNYPVIVTTSKLLSTGVDCKMVKLIVLDQRINSMTEFKQIIGRGTRLREKEGKLYFIVMDFRNVTRLFADPDWDGPIETVDGYYPIYRNPQPLDSEKVSEEDVDFSNYKPIVDKEGCKVKVTGKVVSLYDTNGKLLRTESITDYTKRNIVDRYATFDVFAVKWNEVTNKSVFAEMLKKQGINLATLKHEQGMDGVDDFDFICHIAYNRKPLTRRERAEQVKKRDVFSKYGEKARAVLEALLDKYMNVGVSELENLSVLSNDPFRQFGSPSRIVAYFGDKAGYLNAVKELEQMIYEIA